MKEASDDKMTVKGIIWVTIIGILSFLFFVFINGGF